MKQIILFLFLSIPLTGCTQIGASIANFPTYFDDVKRVADLSYGDQKMQKLDVYVPKASSNKTYPVMMFIHGGNWQMGHKDLYKFLGSQFAEEGYVVVIPNYRKYPQIKYPTFAEDGALAVKWVYENIEKYKGDKNLFYISGHSAGAHTAAMLSTNEEFLKNAGLPDNYIKAFAGLAGPYSFTPEEEDLKDIFGPPDQYKYMQADNFVDGDEPPILLLHGKDDEAVWLTNLEKLSKAYQQNNLPVETKIYDDIDHVEIVTTLTWVYHGIAPVEQDMLAFFAKHR